MYKYITRFVLQAITAIVQFAKWSHQHNDIIPWRETTIFSVKSSQITWNTHFEFYFTTADGINFNIYWFKYEQKHVNC